MVYKKLFDPAQIGTVKLKNRVVMTAIGTGLPTWNGEASEEMIRYYEDRAKGGCGLIIPEFTRVDSESGQCNPNQLCIANRKHVRSIERMADAVHRYGAKIFIQLQHGGREAPPALNGGKQPIAPSAIMNKVSGLIPKEMTVDEIVDIEEKFINAAVNAQRAGADGIELHAAHGYLLSQFISPYTNKRTDEYGGSVENNCRIVTEIITGIQKKCGCSFPISVRINGSDFIEGGIDLDYSVKVAKLLESFNIAALNVSCGVYESAPKMIEPNYYDEGWRKDLAKTIKKNVSIPVIAVNTIKNPETAEKFLQEEVCDFVGVGRGHVADPEWVNKAKAGKEHLIRKCMGCMHCNKSVTLDKALSCAANPVTGHATIIGDEKLIRNGEGRSVVIIGGGSAGMQASVVLAKRGFKPVIIEKNSYLGGAGVLAAQPPHKTLVHDFIETQKEEIKEYGVEVLLNTIATIEQIKKMNPYGVIVATGGVQIVPDIPGKNSKNVFGIEEVLMKKEIFKDKNIAVIGGGIAGLETAHFLCGDNKVTVVEMLNIAGSAMYPTARNALTGILKGEGVEILTGHAITEIKEGAVKLKDMETQEFIEKNAEIVVLALGNCPDRDMNVKLEAEFEKVVFIGDCNKSGTFTEATRSAYDMAFVF
ncbi:NAD(P)/FAD-dependent oxidoreductase [Sedimentibacter sp.]|uniref:NAD(P)/FAD-dependent oxidoreductase n=1 Tax=Sedimentibacter sp. TaxID=1960295 RepID=UPI0028965ACD|nr:NAD(P)/FAD-dependent oxidoreductase [Sedimentibacter sp.]